MAAPEKQYNNQQNDMYNFPYHYLANFSLESGLLPAPVLANSVRYISYWHEVLKQLDDDAFGHIVDVGTGDGFFANKIAASFPAKTVKGVDVSEKGIAFAQVFRQCDNISFLLSDITQEQAVEGGADAATCIEVLEHIPLDQVDGFVKGLADQLKTGGTLVITVPSINLDIKRIKRHFQHFTVEHLDQTLAGHFEPVKSFYVNDRCRAATLITKLIANNHFTLRNQKMLSWLYALYRKHYFYSSAQDGLRVFGVYRKR